MLDLPFSIIFALWLQKSNYLLWINHCIWVSQKWWNFLIRTHLKFEKFESSISTTVTCHWNFKSWRVLKNISIKFLKSQLYSVICCFLGNDFCCWKNPHKIKDCRHHKKLFCTWFLKCWDAQQHERRDSLLYSIITLTTNFVLEINCCNLLEFIFIIHYSYRHILFTP